MTDLLPDPSTPLILAGRPYAVQKATLSIGRIASRPGNKTADLGVSFDLTLDVDDDSGEDGAPAPMIQNIPVREAFGRWPRLDELPGLVVAVEGDRLWDAWYGNDAPPLEANRLTFGDWSEGSIQVQWSASWADGPARATLVFDGPVALERIRLHLFEDESIEELVTTIWGPDALAQFEITAIPQMPMQGTPPPRPRGVPEVVSYGLWPTFLASAKPA
jgi:hypothetical protein